jgi:hypothetical protein
LRWRASPAAPPLATDLRPYGAKSCTRARYGNGFTLVELLAATVLSALLMVTLLMVVASLGRERTAIAKRAATQTPPGVVELLRWDLLSARSVRMKDGTMTLSGFGSLDRRTLAPISHRPVDVVYEVRELGGESWLVRRQIEKGQRPLTELICAGVREIRVAPIQGEIRPPATRPVQLPPGALEVAPQMRLQISFNPPRRAIDETVVLR